MRGFCFRNKIITTFMFLALAGPWNVLRCEDDVFKENYGLGLVDGRRDYASMRLIEEGVGILSSGDGSNPSRVRMMQLDLCLLSFINNSDKKTEEWTLEMDYSGLLVSDETMRLLAQKDRKRLEMLDIYLRARDKISWVYPEADIEKRVDWLRKRLKDL